VLDSDCRQATLCYVPLCRVMCKTYTMYKCFVSCGISCIYAKDESVFCVGVKRMLIMLVCMPYE
jgi:hypothetical protein